MKTYFVSIADKLKEMIYVGHKGHEKSKGIALTKSGVTSWGYTWKWVFGCPVELKALDGHVVITTDIYTMDSEHNFEDEKYDCSYSLSSAQDTEWGEICWNCYLTECEIYDLIRAVFKPCVNQLIQVYKAKNPNMILLSDDDFTNMLAACLETIRKQLDLVGEEFEWLFDYGGSINSTVEMWLTDVLERNNLFS